MKPNFVVFALATERKLYYSDDSYYVLGEWMKSFDTEEEAVKFIEEWNPKTVSCTILKVYK